MENQTQQQPNRLTRITYNVAMFIIGIALGAVLFTHCDDGVKQNGSGELGAELKSQYEALKTSYDNLLQKDLKLSDELKKSKIDLTAFKENLKEHLINYGKTYAKGRDVIINNPCKDSLHLAAYDSLNSSCERVQDRNEKVVSQYEVVVETMQQKLDNKDSVIDNRNGVIGLDKIVISAYKDSLSSSKTSNRKKVVRAFFVGVGVGAAAREVVGFAAKALIKR